MCTYFPSSPSQIKKGKPAFDMQVGKLANTESLARAMACDLSQRLSVHEDLILQYAIPSLRSSFERASGCLEQIHLRHDESGYWLSLLRQVRATT